MTDEELEKLARMVAARVTPAAELLTEIGAETREAAAQLRNERAAMPEVTVLAGRIAQLQAELEVRLPPRPRPWHPRWWLKAPAPKWWPARPVWWDVSRTATAVAIVALLALGLESWTMPFTTLNTDGQIWLGLRLTWW